MKVALGPGKLLVILLIVVNVALARDPLPEPPQNCTKVTIGNKEFVKGEVFLSSHQDTAALKPFGFRDFAFAGRSIWSVKYSAVWPVNVPLDKLPPGVSGLNYLIPGPYPVEDAPDIEENESLDIPAKHNQEAIDHAYRRMISVYPGDDVSLSDFLNVRRSRPRHDGKPTFLTPKEVIDAGEEPYNRVVPKPIDPSYVRTPQQVTTRDDPRVGTFHTRPDPGASSLRPTDFGILRNYSTLQTGQTFFTSRSGSIQDWQRVGVPLQVRTMSVQEYQRRYGRR